MDEERSEEQGRGEASLYGSSSLAAQAVQQPHAEGREDQEEVVGLEIEEGRGVDPQQDRCALAPALGVAGQQDSHARRADMPYRAGVLCSR